MKADELMIGDWMQHANGNYFRVTRIDKWGDGSTHFACGHPHLWEYNNKFSPIPLTGEILEKNGFVKQDYDGWVISEKFGRRFISYRTDYFDGLLKILYAEEPFCDLCLKIKYVHELQHALRLCNIEKEIKL